MVKRSCEVCSASFESSRPSARFCGTTCRTRAHRDPGVVRKPSALPVAVVGPDGLMVAAVRAELEASGRDGTYMGALALTLADRMDGSKSIMGYAAMAKELRSTMDAALVGVKSIADPVDELRLRRDRVRDAG